MYNNLMEDNIMQSKKKYINKLAIIAVILSCISGVLSFGKPSLAKTITIEKGKTYKLKIKKGSKIKCSNKKIAKVNKKGKILALKKGKCTINVKYKKKHIKYSVKVTEKVSDSYPVPTESVPMPTDIPPSLLNGGAHKDYRGLYVIKMVRKDSDICSIYMGRNPKSTFSYIEDDSPFKYINVEITYDYLNRISLNEGDYVTCLADINADTELIDDTLYVKGSHYVFRSENWLYQDK